MLPLVSDFCEPEPKDVKWMINHRDLALAAMRGELVERVPFIARMELWYNYNANRGTLPDHYQNWSLWDIQRDLGIGIFGFGAWDQSFYKTELHGVNVTRTTDNGTGVTNFDTPFGKLTAMDRMSDELMEAAGTGARIEFPFKSPSDYDALEYLLDNTEIVDNFDNYGKFVEEIGTDGIALPFSGYLHAHQLMINYMGYERFYYELYENESRLLRLVDAIERQQNEILSLAAQSPSQAIEVGGNYDEQMTPPPIFERFFSPFYKKAHEVLSASSKVLVIHGDGEMKKLLSLIKDCGVQVVEAVTPKPMTSIDIKQVRELWGDEVTLWGGLPSIIFTPVFTDAEFETHIEELFETIGEGKRFILGFGDNAPTDAMFQRIKRIAKFWNEKR
ncbi:MAG: uroporphyrinogen decarboxylase family protein [Thermoplasmata archaeon]|nr:uroporphyrinogen decarboxylase family protein [Thermoplasmata archaeon]